MIQTQIVHKNRHEIDNSILNRKDNGCTLRDLYNRKDKLRYWINKTKTDLEGTDIVDVLKLVEHMQDKERASLWIVRCITALITIRKQLGKSFRNATKEDIRQILKWQDLKGKTDLLH